MRKKKTLALSLSKETLRTLHALDHVRGGAADNTNETGCTLGCRTRGCRTETCPPPSQATAHTACSVQVCC